MQHFQAAADHALSTAGNAETQAMRDSLVLHIKQEEGLMGKHCTDTMANGYALPTQNGSAARDAWSYRDTLGFRSTPPERTAATALQNVNTAFNPTQLSSMDWGNVARSQSSQYYGSALSTQPTTYPNPAAPYGWDPTHHTQSPFPYGLPSTHGMYGGTRPWGSFCGLGS